MWLFSMATGGSAVGAWWSESWPWLVAFVVFGTLTVICGFAAFLPRRGDEL
jgi:hypothetical protein